MHKTMLIGTVLSVAVLATLGPRAEAGFHHWAAKYGYAPYPCFVIPGGAGTRDVTTGYTIGFCPPPVHRCCIAAHLAMKHARRAAAPGAGCAAGYCGAGACGDGYSCGGGYSCGDGGCCGDYVDGQTTGGITNEEVLYDGPAASAPGEEVESVPTNEVGVTRGAPYRFVSKSTPSGGAEFDRGLNAFRSRSLTDALQSFEAAAAKEPDNAMYHYYRALTLFEISGADAARDALRQAVELERREPIANWGKRMERVQGRSRLWIEKSRREAGLVR